MFLKPLVYSFYFLIYATSNSELIIGEERVDPGIVFIFEGAIKDQIISNYVFNYKSINFKEIAQASRN